MKKYSIMTASVLCCLFFVPVAHADEDIFGEYNADIRKPADAKANKIYNAWGKNMANLIKQDVREGIVIDGAGDYADGKVHANGVGDVVVEEGAEVKGPIINQTDIRNTTVIIQKDAKKTKY